MQNLTYNSLVLIHRTLLLYQYEHWSQECPKWIQQVNQYLEISDIPRAVKRTLEKCKKMMEAVETTTKKQIPKLQDANQQNIKSSAECKNFGYIREQLSYLLTALSFLKDTSCQEERKAIFSITNQIALEIEETLSFIEKHKNESIEELEKELRPKDKEGNEICTDESEDCPAKGKFLGYTVAHYPFIHQSFYDELYDLIKMSRYLFTKYIILKKERLAEDKVEAGFTKYPQASLFYNGEEIEKRIYRGEIEPFLDRELYEMFFAKEANPTLVRQHIQREIDCYKHI